MTVSADRPILEIAHTTKDFIAVAFGGLPEGVTGSPVKIALAPYGTPVSDVIWHDAEWDPDLPITARWFYNGDLPPGFYTLWSQIVDHPTEPESKHGYVHLFDR